MADSEQKETHDDRPSKLPIYFSAFLFPGAGQLLQRRWIPAVLFASVFLTFFVIVIIKAIGRLISAMAFATAFANNQANINPEEMSLLEVLLPFLAALITYITGLIDTLIAHKQALHKWTTAKSKRIVQSVTVLAFAIFGISCFSSRLMASELHNAIRAGDALRVSSILERRLTDDEVNVPLTDGVTPLHLAAALNHKGIAAMLLICGADIEAATSSGFTPLHWAAGKNAADTAQLLLTAGAQINAKSRAGITPLHWAAGKNATNVVSLLIRSGTDLDLKTNSGFTPLHWAILKQADDTTMMLAYAKVANQLDIEAITNEEPEEKIEEIPHETDDTESRAPQTEELAASFGAILSVPIGRGESLEFVWIEKLGLWMGKYEITNRQYRRFNSRHTSMFRERFSLDGDQQPAVYVSWKDATEYCKWLNKEFSDRIPQGTVFRLPTDREWVTAAQCGDNRIYPWGNNWPPKYGNYSDITARENLPYWQGIKQYNDGFAVACPVSDSGANEAGIYGLGGNVWEWCDDWFDPDKKYKVRHGASWDYDGKDSIRIKGIGFDSPKTRDDTIGFRVVVAIR
ncbi:MAG: SUMF1/EgtB/PvdO family nonheme iron enzyme [Lentisphaerae bacterium]|nr:SUMF1/EgtB/PvdO family nonheme iron enzyme [Lentisphaerota bacterium]